MTDWNPLHGNPAPGDPPRILRTGVSECSRIADTSKSARTELERITGELSSAIWQGEAASEFAKIVPNVLEDLRKLEEGYGDVADALDRYATVLASLQDEASATLNKARAAEVEVSTQITELRSAESFRDQLRSHRDGAEVEVRNREAAARSLANQKLQLQSKRAQSSDPVQIAAIDQAILRNEAQLQAAYSQHRAAVSHLQNVENNFDDAELGVRKVSSNLSDAKTKLQLARHSADHIREQHRRNAQHAASSIRAAKGTALGSDWDRFRHRIRESGAFKAILSFVDEVSNKLGAAVTICSVLALVPGLNVVFGPVAATLGIVAAALAVTQFLMREFEGRSSGWQRLDNFAGVALSVAGVKGNIATLKAGWKTSGSLKTLKSAFDLGQKNATLGRESLKRMTIDFKKALGQIDRRVTMLRKGTFLDVGTNRLKMTVFSKTIGGKLVPGSLKSISGFDIVESLAKGKVTVRNVADAYLGKTTVEVVQGGKEAVDIGKKFIGAIKDLASPNDSNSPDPQSDHKNALDSILSVCR